MVRCLTVDCARESPPPEGQGLFMKFFSTRTSNTLYWPERCLLGLYAALAFWMSAGHASWSDEAQAWLIAHDCTLGQILFVRMHYEGTPALWHLLLWVLARLGLPYGAMHALSVAAGLGAAYLVLRFSPFARPIRWLLPFTFALLFQTAVVARSYSLVPLFAFALCVTILSRKPRPMLVAVLAGLLANTSLIALCLAAGLVAYFLFHLRGLEAKPEKKRLWTAGAVLVVLGLFAIYTAIPAPDQNTGEAHGLLSNHAVRGTIAFLTGIPQPKQIAPKKPLVLPPAPAISSASGYPQRVAQWLQPANGHPSGAAKLALTTITWLSLLFFPVSSLNLLALAFYVALLVWLFALRRWTVTLPLVVVLLGAKFLPFGEHHSAVLWSGLIATLWLAADATKTEATRWRLALSSLLLTLTLAEQIGWTAAAALRTPFDGGQQAAQALGAGQHIAGFDYHVVAAQAYAPGNLFFNTTSRYWSWKIGEDAEDQLAATVAQQPLYILSGESYTGSVTWRNQIATIKPSGALLTSPRIRQYLYAHGYRETRRFCGSQPAQFGFSERNCQVIYQPLQP